MSTLQIIIELLEDEDYDGNPEVVKELSGKIDGQHIAPVKSFESSVPDAECRVQYKEKLSDLEYTWTAEI